MEKQMAKDSPIKPPPIKRQAAALARTLVDAHQEPSMAADRRAALDDFVERRVAEGGVETDY